MIDTTIKVKPSQAAKIIQMSIVNNFPLLLTGPPGFAKTSLVKQGGYMAGVDVMISHPVVSDPTDYKGLPFKATNEDVAQFLPYRYQYKLMKAEKPLIFFLDDFGQALPMVQAACMQLLLERRIDTHKISDNVIFMAATNRRQDRAAVKGILDPVKSRFTSIIEVGFCENEWADWAIRNMIPFELVAFVRYRPDLITNSEPTSEIANRPNPRTLENAGKILLADVDSDIEFPLLAGAVGEAYATEFVSFRKIFKSLPKISAIEKDPDSVEVPSEQDVLFAITASLAHKATAKNFGNILKYGLRLPMEFQARMITEIVKRNNKLADTVGFADWAKEHQQYLS